MRILLLTQYFPPETGAPQNRLYSLAQYLKELGAEMHVLTAMPSYPQSVIHPDYKGKSYFSEEMEGVRVYRCPIYVSKKKDALSRLLNYFSFVFTALYAGLFKTGRYDLLICESPPLFLGITALLLKWIKRCKLVINISDLWPRTPRELGIITNPLLLGVSCMLEARMYRSADLVSGQTQGIIDDIAERFPRVPLHLLRNGIDPRQFSRMGNAALIRERAGISETAFVIGYAGIMGHVYDFNSLLIAAQAVAANKEIQFLLVGDGPVKQEVVAQANAMKLENVHFLPGVPFTEMPDVIAASDCYVTPLKNKEVLKGAIPSKVFEPLFYGKPILLGVDGEAKTLFVDTGKCALHFTPEQPDELIRVIRELTSDKNLYRTLGENGKAYVNQYFNRATLAREFWQKLQTL